MPYPQSMLCNLINTILSPVHASPSTSQSPLQVSPLYRPELTTTGQSLVQTRYQYSLVTSTIQLPVEVSYSWFLTLKFINNFIFEFIIKIVLILLIYRLLFHDIIPLYQSVMVSLLYRVTDILKITVASFLLSENISGFSVKSCL